MFFKTTYSVHIRVHVPTIVKEVYVKKPVHEHHDHDDHGSSSGSYGGSSSFKGSLGSYGSGDDSYSSKLIISILIIVLKKR